jgi:two-component system, OmpR family, sensor kinase
VEQALGNLVDNALAHDAASVRLSARPGADGLVELHVTDDGPGFPEDFVAHAFDRFTRADEARGRGGTGLGLAIVDLIAQAHGGSAGAANRPQGGADVWLAVPAAESSREERSQLSVAQSS